MIEPHDKVLPATIEEENDHWKNDLPRPTGGWHTKPWAGGRVCFVPHRSHIHHRAAAPFEQLAWALQKSMFGGTSRAWSDEEKQIHHPSQQHANSL